MHFQTAAWGGLDCRVVCDLQRGRKPRLAVVLCHGYGAPGTDLVSLAQPMMRLEPSLAEQAVFIFPAGCLDLSAQGIPGGRSWWPVDLESLIYRRTPELVRRFRRECPAGLVEARGMLVQLIDEAGTYFDLSQDRFVLGGFSQGAMLATDVALRLPQAPAALCVLSGALINEDEWRILAPQRGPLQVLQSHGRYDSILPFAMGQALRDFLAASGASVEFIAFDGNHEIPPQVVQQVAKLLATAAGS